LNPKNQSSRRTRRHHPRVDTKETTVNDLLHTLAANEIFRALTIEEIEVLIPHIGEETVEAGGLVFEQGQPRRRLVVIKSGIIRVTERQGEQERDIVKYHAGQVLGEAALLDDTPHSTTCRAMVESVLLTLDRETFLELMESSPRLAARVLGQVARTVFARMKRDTGTRGDAGLYGTGATRREHDLLGDRDVPADVYYGVQTLRALENFHITGIPLSHFPAFIQALAMVKKASALANQRIGLLEDDVADAIIQACDEIVDGHLHNQFVVDMIQGGAGTSTNMNANEVIANRALEILGEPMGSYVRVHPNDHVNKSQSTNDVYPTAVRLAILLKHRALGTQMRATADAFLEKAGEFAGVIKMGRTQLQDAVPMTMGQEFAAWGNTIDEDVDRIEDNVKLCLESTLGGTAIGTGIAADDRYAGEALKALREVTGLDFTLAPDLVEASSDVGDMLVFSGILRRIAVKISKVCNDLRLLSSGPRCGFAEIRLPMRQPGSSIMPGKVNPVIPEVVNQVAFQVIGNDLTVTLAAEAGQLELNVMEPVIVFNLFQSIDMLTRAFETLRARCIEGIEVDAERCRTLVYDSIGIVTALLPRIGYAASTEVASEAQKTGRSVADIVVEKGHLTREQLDEILDPEKMTRPTRLT
jgi:aspartate ammonia-lyase